MIKNSKLRLVLLAATAVTLVGSIHMWTVPSDNLDLYFIVFIVLYGVLCSVSIALAVKLRSWLRLASCLNFLIAALILAGDCFMLALRGMQF